MGSGPWYRLAICSLDDGLMVLPDYADTHSLAVRAQQLRSYTVYATLESHKFDVLDAFMFTFLCCASSL